MVATMRDEDNNDYKNKKYLIGQVKLHDISHEKDIPGESYRIIHIVWMLMM